MLLASSFIPESPSNPSPRLAGFLHVQGGQMLEDDALLNAIRIAEQQTTAREAEQQWRRATIRAIKRDTELNEIRSLMRR